MDFGGISGILIPVRRWFWVCLLVAGCGLVRPQTPDVGFVSRTLLDAREPTAAVLPFVNQSGYLGADYWLTDEFNLRLGMTGLFRLVERVRVKELYREQDFDPSRISDTDAVRIGKMLGAQYVLLGAATWYKIADRPPEVPADAFPVLVPAENEAELVASILANTVTALVAFISMKQPVAEVGASVRLVSTETGEIVWQARNRYVGSDKELTLRRPREEWDRMRKDVVFLTSILATDMVRTLPDGLEKLRAEVPK